jgi:tetrachlorobenzoquinone reductase
VNAAESMMQVRIKRISYEAESVNSYELVAPAGGDLVPFTAGSHIDLHLSNGMIRSYSLVNDQSERSRYVIAVNNDAAAPGLSTRPCGQGTSSRFRSPGTIFPFRRMRGTRF